MSLTFARTTDISARFDPSRVNRGAAGFDLFNPEEVTLAPGETAKIDLKVTFTFPPGHYGQLFLRSSASLLGISIHGGVIGELGCS
jgi:dUTPase